MGAQTCKCECDADKKEIAGAGHAVTTSTGFEEEVEIKAPTVSKTAIASPSACAPKTGTTREDVGQSEQSSVENTHFASEDQSPPSCPAPPEPLAQKVPITPTPAEQPPAQKASIAATAAKPEDREMPEDTIAGTRKLVFDIEANKALEATFAEFNGAIDAGSSQSGRGLLVTSVSQSSVLMMTKDGSCGIRAGDTILQVQGEKGAGGNLLKLLRDAKLAGGRLEMVVRSRPETFEVTIQRTGDEKMGISVSLRDDLSDKVEIQQVLDEGAVQAWNFKNPLYHVVSGDCISAINRNSKAPSEMIQDMQECWQNKTKIVLQLVTSPPHAGRDTKKKPDS